MTEKRHKQSILCVVLISTIVSILGLIISYKHGVVRGKYVLFLASAFPIIICCIMYLISYRILKTYRRNAALTLSIQNTKLTKIASIYTIVFISFYIIPVIMMLTSEFVLKHFMLSKDLANLIPFPILVYFGNASAYPFTYLWYTRQARCWLRGKVSKVLYRKSKVGATPPATIL